VVESGAVATFTSFGKDRLERAEYIWHYVHGLIAQ
jgi:hypothetical protein